MKYHRKEFSGFSLEDEDANVAAIVKGKARFCHPLLRHVPNTAVETPMGIDLFKYVSSDRPLNEKLKAIAAAFDCLSVLHDVYRCFHLDAKASNFIVYDCSRVYLIDFETLCRCRGSPLPGDQNVEMFDHMSVGLCRFGFKPHLHYEINSDIAYRYDVFSLAMSLYEHAYPFLPQKFLDLLLVIIVGKHREAIVEILPDGRKVTHRTYLRDVNKPIIEARLAATFVRSFKLRSQKRTHSI